MMDLLLKGLGVGLAIAAPVGPIAILCIRRSMTQGRATGLATGLGAAAADATYGLLIAAGVSATGLLLLYAPQMQLFGGLLITCLGLLTLRAFARLRPSGADLPRNLPQDPPQTGSLSSAFGSTYLLTLSNPMTIIAFTGMIAGLGGAASGQANAAYILVVGVFLGSALWWMMIVHLALWARRRLTGDLLRWLDLVAGLVLTLWGLWLLA